MNETIHYKANIKVEPVTLLDTIEIESDKGRSKRSTKSFLSKLTRLCLPRKDFDLHDWERIEPQPKYLGSSEYERHFNGGHK